MSEQNFILASVLLQSSLDDVIGYARWDLQIRDAAEEGAARLLNVQLIMLQKIILMIPFDRMVVKSRLSLMESKHVSPVIKKLFIDVGFYSSDQAAWAWLAILSI